MADADNGPLNGTAKSDGAGLAPAISGASASAAKAKAGKPADPGAENVVGAPLMTVVVRNEFYRDGFRNLIKIAIVEAVIIVALIITFIAYIDTVKPQDHYFATTADGRIMELKSTEDPYMSESALLTWATEAATETMSFGFHDYQRRLQTSSKHFTQRGWETFATALTKNRVIETVQALQQVVSAEPRSAPYIVQKGVFDGKYRWIVKLPLKVTYRAGTGSRVDNPDVTLVIDRVDQLENSDGVAIEQWTLNQPDAGN